MHGLSLILALLATALFANVVDAFRKLSEEEEKQLVRHCGRVGPARRRREVVDKTTCFERRARCNRARVGQIPWAAMIQIPDGYRRIRCSGTLISQRHVVTAAHCVYADPNSCPRRGHRDLAKLGARVALGHPNIRDRKARYFKVVDQKEGSFADCKGGDLLILELDRDVKFNQNARPICMPPFTMKRKLCIMKKLGRDFQELKPTGYGYGYDAYLKGFPDTLEFAEIFPLVGEPCRQGKVPAEEGQFCTNETRQTYCMGDSGTGLQIQGKLSAKGEKRALLAGVLSRGISCDEAKKGGLGYRLKLGEEQGIRGVLTDVGHHYDLFCDTIGLCGTRPVNKTKPGGDC